MLLWLEPYRGGCHRADDDGSFVAFPPPPERGGLFIDADPPCLGQLSIMRGAQAAHNCAATVSCAIGKVFHNDIGSMRKTYCFLVLAHACLNKRNDEVLS